MFGMRGYAEHGSVCVKFEIVRDWLQKKPDENTTGTIWLRGVLWGLELAPPRYFNGQENVHMKCCILAGLYELKLEPSPTHGNRLFPTFQNVSGRSHILWHSVQEEDHNKDDSTGCEGCGTAYGSDGLLHGGFALISKIIAAMQQAFELGDRVFCEISLEQPPTGALVGPEPGATPAPAV